MTLLLCTSHAFQSSVGFMHRTHRKQRHACAARPGAPHMSPPPSRFHLLYLITCVCMRSKAWLAARMSLRRVRMRRPARACACGCVSPYRAHHFCSMPCGENVRCWWYRRVPKFSPYGSVCCACAQRPGCRARVTPASSPASHCKQCSALTSPSLYARGCASPSRACFGHKTVLKR